jgi:hypothetical protein
MSYIIEWAVLIATIVASLIAIIGFSCFIWNSAKDE